MLDPDVGRSVSPRFKDVQVSSRGGGDKSRDVLLKESGSGGALMSAEHVYLQASTSGGAGGGAQGQV